MKPRSKAGNFSIGLMGGPAAALLVLIFGNLEPGNPEVTYTLAIALLMAIWWITEAVPLAVTSLLPVALFPLLGIMEGKAVAATYFNHVIFLFIGGFILALAMQKWDLHRRIALRILLMTGTSPARILLGFMLATAFLSMWISNTATAMLMIPIVMSIIQELVKGGNEKSMSRFSIGLLLGIAYSASIGGIATLVGTPPNLSFARIFQIYFENAPDISFARWFIFALPISAVVFTITYFYLFYTFRPARNESSNTPPALLREQYSRLGKVSYEEYVVFTAFISMALLWLLRADIDLGLFVVKGWAAIFNTPDYIDDGTIAIFISVILFAIPSGKKYPGRIMDWQTARDLPWNIVLLFGGGFALASGFKVSGLSEWFGAQLSFVAQASPIVIIFTIAIMMTFLTELTSNTATTEMILPILAGLALSIEINPLYLMLPATLSASMAFMLPVATPPNAIIFGTNRLSVMDMARTGFVLNILGAIVITLGVYFLGSLIFDMDINHFPVWTNTGK